jgi:FlaA1/EpsC-like NDP-sugar epimerase
MMKLNQDTFKDKKVIVTGGTGSIGSEIVRQLLNMNVAQVRIYSNDEYQQFKLMEELGPNPRLRFLLGDIRDKDRMDHAFAGADICYHAAALKHVPICEYNPFEAVKTNVLGSQYVIELAIKHNLEKVIAISTDKAVDPSSVLGTTKLIMEKLFTSAKYITADSRTKFASVRFGNVLRSRGSVLETWEKQINEGGPVTVTDPNMTRFFMETSDAINLILKATEIMQGREIFVLKMKKTNMGDLAKETVKKFAGDKKIEIKVIGARPGEKLYEKLLSEVELESTMETEDMFVILPEIVPEFAPKVDTKYPYKKIDKNKAIYRSDQ